MCVTVTNVVPFVKMWYLWHLKEHQKVTAWMEKYMLFITKGGTWVVNIVSFSCCKLHLLHKMSKALTYLSPLNTYVFLQWNIILCNKKYIDGCNVNMMHHEVMWIFLFCFFYSLMITWNKFLFLWIMKIWIMYCTFFFFTLKNVQFMFSSVAWNIWHYLQSDSYELLALLF